MGDIAFKKQLFLLLLAAFLIVPQGLLAIELQLSYPEIPGTGRTLNEIAETPDESQLAAIVQYVYYFIVSVAGLLAFAMLVWGGVSYLTSAGNPSVVSDAKDRILKAILGLAVILSSWLILNTVSPELVTLKPLTTEKAEGGPEIPEVTPSAPGVVGFTVDGGASASIESGASITLAWQAPYDLQNYCDASSNPQVDQWQGSRELQGSLTIFLTEEGTYSFFLSCYGTGGKSDTRSVLATVYSGEAPPSGPAPTADLKENGFDGPLYFPADVPEKIPESAEIEFTWTSTDATECVGSGDFGAFIGGRSGSETINLIGPANGTYEYIITCSGPGGSATDSVVLEVEI